MLRQFAPLAQLVEQLTLNQSVGSSSLPRGITQHKNTRPHKMRMPVMTKDDAIMTVVALLLLAYAATGLEMLLITFLFLM